MIDHLQNHLGIVPASLSHDTLKEVNKTYLVHFTIHFRDGYKNNTESAEPLLYTYSC